MKLRPHHKCTILIALASIGAADSAISEEQVRTNTVPQFTPPTLFSTAQTPTPEADIVLLDADEIVQAENSNLVEARGNVQAKNQGRRLSTDRLVYDRNTGIVTAYGNVIMMEPDGSVSYAQELIVDDKLATGVIKDFSSRFPNGGIVAASTAVRRAGDRNILSQVIYTACPICSDSSKPPTWEVRARTATQDQRAKVINYQDVVFEIKGVPVIWVPYFRHADPTIGRQSGFLQPVPGRSSRLGFNTELPYLLLLDKYSDVILSPIISEYVNPVMQAEYRRNFYSGKLLLSGSITNERKFGRVKHKYANGNFFYDDADWRSHIFGTGKFKINDVWNWGFGIENASDDLYLLRYSIGGQGLQRGPIRASSLRLISQAYLEGQNKSFYTRILGVSFQGLIAGELRKNTPKVAPSIEFTKSWDIGPMNGRLDLDSNLLYLSRVDNRQDTARASLGGTWSGQTALANGILIEPKIHARADYYNYKNQRNSALVNIGDKTVTRSNALASLDLRWPLIKPAGAFNFTIEPRLNLSAATEQNRRDFVSLEDYIGYENNHSSYFAPISKSAIDNWNGGSHITIGTSLGVSAPKNTSINWFVGKQFNSASNPFLDRITNQDKKQGDYVSNLEINYDNKVKFGGNVRLDANNLDLVRAEAIASVNWWRVTADLRYHELPLRYGGISKTNRELVTSANFKIAKNLDVFVNNWRDMRTQTNLMTRAGIRFGDECTDVRMFYEEYNTVNGLIAPNKGYKIQIAFKTLGVIDDDPFE